MTEPFVDATDALAEAPRSPVAEVPPRRRRSVRRTSNVDILGAGADRDGLVFRAAGRDLLTDEHGAARELAAVELNAETDVDHVVIALDSSDDTSLDSLVGANIRRRFRAAINESVRSRGGGSLLCLLLDDLPVANVIANYARLSAARPYVGPSADAKADICAGYRADGTQLVMVRETGRRPRHLGPPAPALTAPDDPLAWHALPPLRTHDMRRLRRLDVHRGVSGDLLVDAFFRDSHVDASGDEAIVHEYELTARIDAATWHVQEAVARPHVLPYPECPIAAGSMQALHGLEVGELRAFVRRQLRGPSTCTHLTDLSAMLADVAEIAAPVG